MTDGKTPEELAEEKRIAVEEAKRKAAELRQKKAAEAEKPADDLELQKKKSSGCCKGQSSCPQEEKRTGKK
ncbi:hypothetical protein [Pseudalkalibacillus sp. NRS-1564]|uniref:hypothetical protein n=1 Tax=Pseudalkalibacillus sp. NRS-1564 TaxID=3233900 RepID=UPI003D26ECD3